MEQIRRHLVPHRLEVGSRHVDPFRLQRRDARLVSRLLELVEAEVSVAVRIDLRELLRPRGDAVVEQHVEPRVHLPFSITVSRSARKCWSQSGRIFIPAAARLSSVTSYPAALSASMLTVYPASCSSWKLK